MTNYRNSTTQVTTDNEQDANERDTTTNKQRNKKEY
jgi:hypothetical protein